MSSGEFVTGARPFAVPYVEVHSRVHLDVEFAVDMAQYPAAHAQFTGFTEGYPLQEVDEAAITRVAAGGHDGWHANRLASGNGQPRWKVPVINAAGRRAWESRDEYEPGAIDIARPFAELDETYQQDQHGAARGTAVITRAFLDAYPGIMGLNWQQVEHLAALEHDKWLFEEMGRDGSGQVASHLARHYRHLPNRDAQTGKFVSGGQHDDRQRIHTMLDALGISYQLPPEPTETSRRRRILPALFALFSRSARSKWVG